MVLLKIVRDLEDAGGSRINLNSELAQNKDSLANLFRQEAFNPTGQ
jgi:hypothetical protein